MTVAVQSVPIGRYRLGRNLGRIVNDNREGGFESVAFVVFDNKPVGNKDFAKDGRRHVGGAYDVGGTTIEKFFFVIPVILHSSSIHRKFHGLRLSRGIPGLRGRLFCQQKIVTELSVRVVSGCVSKMIHGLAIVVFLRLRIIIILWLIKTAGSFLWTGMSFMHRTSIKCMNWR